jgi:hypothetical protein
LFINGINDLLIRKHGQTLPWIAPIQNSVPICLARRSLGAGVFVDGDDGFLVGERTNTFGWFFD